MRGIATLMRRFARDERGAFAVIFGLMAVVLVATAGAVVDFVRIEQARSTAQTALDAAALALQPDIYTASDDAIKSSAKALLDNRLADTALTTNISDIQTNTSDGTLYLVASINVPMTFVSLVGVNDMDISVVSEATRKKLYVEVVMVLDNSGSMASGNRMNSLKGAAVCATNVLFLGSCSPGGKTVTADNVKMAIVPFTSLVNVGSAYANAAWVDRGGLAPKSNDNFDDDDDETTPFAGGADRVGLFGGISNVSWKGCMEARLYPHSVSDTEPSAGNPDTLFTPAFAPDEPDNGSAYWTEFTNNYLDDDPAACQVTGTCTCTTTCSGTGKYKSCDTSCTFVDDEGAAIAGTNICSCGTNNKSGTQTCATTASRVSTLSKRERQERLCKYTGTSAWGLTSFTRGPNAGCPDAQILELTDQRAEVINAISAMKSEGATNIHQGTIWGFHVLSPTEPFSEGRAYDASTYKVMIVMTDGENTFYTWPNMNNAQFNQAYGLPYNQREGNMSSTNNSMAVRLDSLLQETCTNAKDAGIDIYTIGLMPPNQRTIDVLTGCATMPSQAYFPQAASDLGDVFKEIAEQLAALRLSR